MKKRSRSIKRKNRNASAPGVKSDGINKCGWKYALRKNIAYFLGSSLNPVIDSYLESFSLLHGSKSIQNSGNTCFEIISHEIEDIILSDISDIVPDAVSIEERRALHRMMDVAKFSVPFLIMLTDPWIGSRLTSWTFDVIKASARIHLYARILDDAIDEDASIHRTILLRAQPLFWQATQDLAILAPTLRKETAEIIQETVKAVESDNLYPQPLVWGSKNHHLLIAPLLLSGNSSIFLMCRPALSAFIALAQARDEWGQGVFSDSDVKEAFFKEIPQFLSNATIELLMSNGWERSAHKLVMDAQKIMESMR